MVLYRSFLISLVNDILSIVLFLVPCSHCSVRSSFSFKTRDLIERKSQEKHRDKIKKMTKNNFITSESCFIEILWHYGNRRSCYYKRKLHIWLLKDKKCTFRSFHGIQNVFMVFGSSQANKGTLLHYLHDTKRKQSIQALLMKLPNNVGRQLPHIIGNSKFHDPMLF